ncbi:Na+/H+ antiporter NhaA type [Acidithiobacillus caldus ATCC 51756]|uniref:Na+/H+ antiporter NhaA type n=1 Tax=Acidithiobacillus caldus (strain ATCC 51756 / DSM 8584 / KU) TaxID=637389 RepID=A0A059ZTJ8_ACICK|nr:Na+/H+ antiporter NhaA type [Acidithiobacillus caldus ATCC 51756]
MRESARLTCKADHATVSGHAHGKNIGWTGIKGNSSHHRHRAHALGWKHEDDSAVPGIHRLAPRTHGRSPDLLAVEAWVEDTGRTQNAGSEGLGGINGTAPEGAASSALRRATRPTRGRSAGSPRRRPTGSTGRRPTRPTGRRPTRPTGRRPTRPTGGRPTRPTGRRPTGSTGRRPTRPTGRRPTRPTGRRPARPTGLPRRRWGRGTRWRRRRRCHPQRTEKGPRWRWWRCAGRWGWWRWCAGRRRRRRCGIVLVVDLWVVVPQLVLCVERRRVPGNIGLWRREVVILWIIREPYAVSGPSQIQTEIQGVCLRCGANEEARGQHGRNEDSVFAVHDFSPSGKVSPFVGSVCPSVPADLPICTKQFLRHSLVDGPDADCGCFCAVCGW